LTTKICQDKLTHVSTAENIKYNQQHMDIQRRERKELRDAAFKGNGAAIDLALSKLQAAQLEYLRTTATREWSRELGSKITLLLERIEVREVALGASTPATSPQAQAARPPEPPPTPRGPIHGTRPPEPPPAPRGPAHGVRHQPSGTVGTRAPEYIY